MIKIKNMLSYLLWAVIFILVGCNQNSVNLQWRNDRTGIYNETGLLKSWHRDGPELLWHYDELGDGFSSVVVSKDKFYVAGMIDDKGYLHVFDAKGNLLNKIMYGDEWTVNYNGTRGSPTIDNGKIYIISGIGDLICFDENTLNVLWKKNIFSEFESNNIRWGITESPLIIGEKLIVTPGGERHNVVALNKNTGELIWSSPGVGEASAYCSPLYVGDLETPLIATKTAYHIIGLEAATGKLLWSFESRNRNQIHSNTPVYADNMILFSSVDKGSVMVQLSEGGRKAEIVWENPDWDNMMGGVIKIGDYVYGSCSGYKNRLWYCLNWNTGEVMYQERGLETAGVIIYADGMFYCYSDRGDVALVTPNPGRFEIVSRFRIEKGTGQHWAHPIIYNGTLYVRRGNSLMAYKIKS